MDNLKSLSDISIEELEQSPNESFIIDSISYSATDLIKYKNIIQEILSQMPQYDGADKEKKMFSFIYVVLAHKLDYDDFAANACDFVGYDREASENLRNSASGYNGLITGRSIFFTRK